MVGLNSQRTATRLLPVYVCWDSQLTRHESQAVLAGIAEIASAATNRHFENYGNEKWSTGDYSSADWYVERAHRRINQYSRKIQISSLDILLQLHDEPWQQQQPHLDLLVTSQDLFPRVGDFVFGEAIPSWGVSVQSVWRFRNAGLSIVQQQACIRRVVRHELGHLLGMVSDGRRNTEEKLGLHCANPVCSMRQGVSVTEWNRLATGESVSSSLFCPDCIADLR